VTAVVDEKDDPIRTVKLDVLNKEHQSLVVAGQQYHRALVWEIRSHLINGW
jgi:hypothetical protein